MLRHELIPYLVKCFHRLYPNRSLSGALLDSAYFDEILRETGVIASPAPEQSPVGSETTPLEERVQ